MKKEYNNKSKVEEECEKYVENEEVLDEETIRCLLKSIDDIENGRTISAEKVFEELRIKYGF